jgi:hypothetical protein
VHSDASKQNNQRADHGVNLTDESANSSVSMARIVGEPKLPIKHRSARNAHFADNSKKDG